MTAVIQLPVVQSRAAQPPRRRRNIDFPSRESLTPDEVEVGEVDLKAGVVHVNRLKNGGPSVAPAARVRAARVAPLAAGLPGVALRVRSALTCSA
jgi:hypothetical protein